jgi:hypothetical protein
MESNTTVGASILTVLVGVPLCIYGGIVGGWAGLLSAVIFIIGFYQYLLAMAWGGPGIGMYSLLVIVFEWFVLFCISGLLFGQEITFQAASYWKEPIAFGNCSIENIWIGITTGDSAKKWLGMIQLSGMAGIILVIYFLIHLLGRGSND